MTPLTDRPLDLVDDEVDADDLSSNPSTAPCFQQVVQARLSRRSVLRGGMLAAAAFMTTKLYADTPAAYASPPKPVGTPGGKLGFTPISLSTADEVRVPPGYRAVPFIPWGTPLRSTGPAFVPGSRDITGSGNTAAEQEQQIGMHHDGMHYFRTGHGYDGNYEGLLVVNHEYTDEDVLHTGKKQPSGWTAANRDKYTAEMVRKSQAAHGVSVVQIAQQSLGDWKVLDSRFNRRITANTPMTFSGAAADSPLLDTGKPADGTNPVGTINNCAHGFTPWGTYLTCEENFNGYFAVPTTKDADGKTVTDLSGFSDEQAELLQRYGVGGDRYNWALHDPRFVVTPERPNEPNRFGWVVEIDPRDPKDVPQKRTALGRIKHEGAFVHVSDSGHVVVYMGDDQANDYAYKFVSARPWRELVNRGKSPLDEGTLYVARFNDDGSGEWLPLVAGQGPLTSANGFANQAEVLIKARLAADALGATPMDRPEWTTVDPETGMVYLTLTNNTRRTEPNGPNPRVLVEEGDADGDGTPNEVLGNPWGQIVRWEEEGNDHTATSFTWDLFVLAGQGRDSGADDGSTIEQADAFGSPDGLWADDHGRIWIQTDGRQPDGAHNQMLAADPTRVDAAGAPEIRRFLTAVKGCEVTGVITTPNKRTMFINIQHPVTDWPRLEGLTTPRSSTVVIVRNNGGVIGT